VRWLRIAVVLVALVLIGAVATLWRRTPRAAPRVSEGTTLLGGDKSASPSTRPAETGARPRTIVSFSAPAPGSGQPPLAPQPRYRPRDSREWQGMLVDESYEVLCKDFCGLALACVSGVCRACTSDTDCGRHESCVLDHCLDSSRVSCRSYRDCGPQSLCVLSGLSPDPRGNAELRSFCSSEGAADP